MGPRLSVLALSSRFDGQLLDHNIGNWVALSVLALSSRFDGLLPDAIRGGNQRLSVLALSSRFDGRVCVFDRWHKVDSFSTRSVESF